MSRAGALLAVLLVGCGAASVAAREPEPVAAVAVEDVTNEPEPEETVPPEVPDGCFAAACERAYGACVDAEDETDCDAAFAACLADRCANVEPVVVEPVALRDLLFSVAAPEPARGACPPPSDELFCESSGCVATSDGRHEACITESQSLEEEGTTYGLVVRDGRRWARVIPAFGRAADTASMTSSSIEIAGLRWIEGAGGPWLELRWLSWFTDADWCTGTDGGSSFVALCSVAGGRTRCTAALRLRAIETPGGGRIDLAEDVEDAELDACADEAGRRALEIDAWTAAQPVFDVAMGAGGALVWTDRPALLDGVETLADLGVRAEGLRALGDP